MTLPVLITVTLACIAWSLWVRRLTWTSRWEVAATLNIALQGLAVLLMTPWASATIGHWLYNLTGMWNLEDFIAHDAYVVAASAVVYNAIGRIEDGAEFQRAFKVHVETPATLCIPLLLAAFSFGNGAAMYHPDFFQVPTDFWLNTYWLIMCGTTAYLLAYGSKALLLLRLDERSRTVATVYLIAAGFGIITCLIRIATAYITPLQNLGPAASLAVWFPACACGALFAIMSAHAWKAKLRWFKPKAGDAPSHSPT